MIVHVVGPATGMHTQTCFLRLVSRIAGGGRATFCIRTATGAPGANAVVHVRGEIVFRLPHRTLRARVLVVDRFAADGRHARQALRGTIVGGGTIAGGGRYVEDVPGHVASSDLRYRLTLR